MSRLKIYDMATGTWQYAGTVDPAALAADPAFRNALASDPVLIAAISASLASVVRPSTVAAVTPVLGDENCLITLSNALAITITLPSNATVPFKVNSEISYLWLGVGQPSFVAGAGATVNATPGLKLRAQYSAATAKKIATDAWVVMGDVGA